MKKFILVTAFMMLFVSCAQAQSLYERLLEVDGVISVERIEQEEQIFDEKYILTLQQPIDWSDPESEFFPQRVEIGYQSGSSINVFYVGGYDLNENRFPKDDRHELVKMYNANMIKPEYRFFSKSSPEGLSNDSTALWQYLTDENASHDFHRIISELQDILSGKWIFAGTSKGGAATFVYASYYPDDADIFVPLVAPFGDETDGKFTRYLYEEIGNGKYGAEQAAKYRAEVLEFQVEAVKNREYLENYYWNIVEAEDLYMRPYVTKGKLFDMIILEYGVMIWQYYQDFEELERILAMPREDDPSTENDEKQEFLDAAVKHIEDAGAEPSTWAVNKYFPYYVQCAVEEGDRDYRFTHLRAALAAEGSGAYLEVTPDMEKDILFRMVFTDEQFEAFKFSPDTRNRVYDFLKTTDSKILILYSKSDPWYALHVPEDNDNPNVYYFADEGQSHTFRIAKMPEDMKEQVTALIDSAVYDAEQDISSGVGSSGSGCNSVSSGMILIVILGGLLFVRRDIIHPLRL